jgi:CheY-like chemotaxis protein
MKIFVLDDSVDNINLIKLYVKKSNDDFTFFTSPTEAVECLQNEKFDIIFLDIQMPELDGFEVLEKIREDKCNQNSFVCALSAFSLDKEVEKIKDTSFDDYLQKPILRVKFLEYIDSHREKKAS